MEHVDSLLNFLIYFCAGLAYFIAFIFIYIRITPYAEIKLINEGNSAAAITLGGAVIGYALPLARAIEQSSAAVDLLVWATLALFVQIAVFGVLHILLPQLSKNVAENQTSKAIFLAALSIAVGFLNAASMTI
jgi:putative membrane protein